MKEFCILLNQKVMKKNTLLFILVLSLVACGPSLQVSSDQDKTVKIDGYKSYGWLDIKAIENRNNDPRYYNELTDKRIKEAVGREMLAKGYNLVPGKPELELHYHIIVENKTSISTEPVGINYGEYWAKKMTTVYQYREGTLIIDIMDVKTNQLVWRGSGTDVITESATKDPQTAINNAVREIFKKFTP